MTEQTPKERLEEREMFFKLQSVIDALHEAGEYVLFRNAIDYRNWTEARIKELEAGIEKLSKENTGLKGIGKPCVDCGGGGVIMKNGVCNHCGGRGR